MTRDSQHHILVLVNDPEEVKSQSTTADLIRLCGRPGWKVSLAGVKSFWLNHRASAMVTCVDPSTQRATDRRLMVFDLVLSRTNPARDAPANVLAHRFAMRLLKRATGDGLLVLNDPAGLELADSKAFLLELSPLDRPATIVVQDPGPALAFIDTFDGDAVIKPAHGTHGTGVIRLVNGAAGNRQIIASLLDKGPLVVQPFLPEASAGDTRVLLVDGGPLVHEGNTCAVRRIPAEGDFRSNVAAGGSPARAEITPGMRRVIERVGPRLREAGLWLVGLDFVGDRIIEINAYSPGGLADASRFEGVDFAAALAQRLVHKVAKAAAVASASTPAPS